MSGHFDAFVVRVSESEQQSDTLEFTVPGEVRNITVSNLMDATGYDIELYGISHGRHTPSVLVHTVTGTKYFTHILRSKPQNINELKYLLGKCLLLCSVRLNLYIYLI